MIKTVIFDFNGTLFLDSHYHERVWIDYAKSRFNKDVSVQEFKTKFMGKPNIKILQELDSTLTLEQAEFCSNEKERLYREMVINDGNPCLIKGAIELFTFLKEVNIPYTIASAANVENFNFYRKVFDLDRYFDPNLLVIDDGTYSSKVEMYKAAMQLLGGKCESTYVFEDSSIGIDCALKAGVGQIGIISNTKIDTRFNSYCDFNQVLQDRAFVLECKHD